MANRVVDKHTFSLSGCQLTAERYHGLKPDAGKFNKNVTPVEEVQPVPELNQVPQDQAKVKETPPERNPVEERVNLDDGEMSSEGSSSDESELQSCTIEVSGVSKNTSQETVKMFFESRRKSGGAKVDNIWFNKENGHYVITFLERERKSANRINKIKLICHLYPEFMASMIVVQSNRFKNHLHSDILQ